jgi:hypothetical protein
VPAVFLVAEVVGDDQCLLSIRRADCDEIRRRPFEQRTDLAQSIGDLLARVKRVVRTRRGGQSDRRALRVRTRRRRPSERRPRARRAESATPAARAVVAAATADGSARSNAEGLRYLLEVSLAREAIEVWRAWRPGQTPSLEDKLAAVTCYAEHDAWLPVA